MMLSTNWYLSRFAEQCLFRLFLDIDKGSPSVKLEIIKIRRCSLNANKTIIHQNSFKVNVIDVYFFNCD